MPISDTIGFLSDLIALQACLENAFIIGPVKEILFA